MHKLIAEELTHVSGGNCWCRNLGTVETIEYHLPIPPNTADDCRAKCCNSNMYNQWFFTEVNIDGGVPPTAYYNC
jgi:hypothetical protein